MRRAPDSARADVQDVLQDERLSLRGGLHLVKRFYLLDVLLVAIVFALLVLVLLNAKAWILWFIARWAHPGF